MFGVQTRHDLVLFVEQPHVKLLLLLMNALLRSRIVPNAAKRVSWRVEGCAKRFDNPPGLRSLLTCVGERTDRHNALRSIMKFKRLPTVRPQFLGQQVRILGSLDEWIVVILLVPAPGSFRFFRFSRARLQD